MAANLRSTTPMGLCVATIAPSPTKLPLGGDVGLAALPLGGCFGAAGGLGMASVGPLRWAYVPTIPRGSARHASSGMRSELFMANPQRAHGE